MNKEQLKEFLINPNKEQFPFVAKEIINGFIICKENIRYSFAEVEFYYYGKDQKDSHTYIRRCKAEEWFFHYSGVDIAFETKEESNIPYQFGGILIRSIIKHEGEKENELIAGPLRCLQEIFNGCKEFPTIEEKHPRSCHEVGQNTRYGIGNDRNNYRFFINDADFDWDCPTKRLVYDKKSVDGKTTISIREKDIKVKYAANPIKTKSE